MIRKRLRGVRAVIAAAEKVTKADGITSVSEAPEKSNGTDSLSLGHFYAKNMQGKAIQSSGNSMTKFMNYLSQKNRYQYDGEMGDRDCQARYLKRFAQLETKGRA